MWLGRTSLALAATAVVLLTSCVNRRYRVEMSGEGPELARTISAFRLKDGEWNAAGFRREDADRIARIYALAGRSFESASGRFVAVPDDVGGAGSYEHWPTRLGDACQYVERFRGQIDLWGEIERLEVASNRIADELIGFFGIALADEPGLAELQRFLDGPFRRDLKTIALLFRPLGGPVPELANEDYEEAYWTVFVRIGDYLVERGYFAPDDLPALFQGQEEMDGASRILDAPLRVIADRMGIGHGEPLPPGLLRLADRRYAERSWKLWERSRDENPEDDPIDPYLEWLFFDLEFSGSLEVEVALRTGREPFATNGEWNADAGQVQWPARPIDRKHTPALIRYAFWSVPDEPFQTERFGDVVLAGQELWLYAMWFHALPAPLAAEWDELLSGLRPGDGLAQLQSFRFSEGDASGATAAPGLELLGGVPR